MTGTWSAETFPVLGVTVGWATASSPGRPPAPWGDRAARPTDERDYALG